MKRGLLTGFVLILLISMTLVSAQSSIGDDVTKGLKWFTDAVSPVFSAILGDVPGESQYFFAKILFFIIIFAVIWTALGRVDFFAENTWVLIVVGLAASILSTRWIATPGLINAIILPYSALGIAISAGLPFVLYFLVVNLGFHDKPAVFRRVAWIFFAVIFIGLWIARRGESQLAMGNAAYIYLVTAAIALLMMLFDGTIHKLFVKMNLEKLGQNSATDAITELKTKIGDLPTLVKKDILTQAEADRRRKKYGKQIMYLSK